ncbi:hypothetical protein [Pantoea piersonii]|uniref:hypothetical protein n=1 Tax=Pantoea piersonii TaxID=2364647 RepID=UPI0022F1A8B2|nr:hypothetical protein [Pantoea piersonii]WBV22602.1 hypothetical protein PG877_05440 [Pantoea piersonii]
MDKLSRLFHGIRDAQSSYRRITDEELALIAKKCHRDEVAAIHIRLKLFRAELAVCPDWDGDTQDSIWEAISMHQRLLAMVYALPE